ncbi:MAG TPA: DUF2149 domain-containing protein [Thermoleophilia bacterium]
MPSNDDHSRLQNLGTVVGAPETGLRYMRRRRIGTADRNGDPLDGIVNLFDVAIVLAVGFLVAALSAAGVTGLLTSKNMTIVTNPGTPQMQVIVKEGDKITKLDMQSGAQVEGMGTLIGSFYKLADGTVVYVPAGQTAPSGSTPVPGTTPTPGATTAPAITPTPAVTLTPEATPTPTTAPTTSSTTFPTPTPAATR